MTHLRHLTHPSIGTQKYRTIYSPECTSEFHRSRQLANARQVKLTVPIKTGSISCQWNDTPVSVGLYTGRSGRFRADSRTIANQPSRGPDRAFSAHVQHAFPFTWLTATREHPRARVLCARLCTYVCAARSSRPCTNLNTVIFRIHR